MSEERDELALRDRWLAEAGKISTPTELADFVNELAEQDHDYGTIVHAICAAMKAAFTVVNDSPQGGITGFQAGFIAWWAIDNFMSIKGPAKIIDYREMIYPQYEEKFDKVISQETWQAIQDQAKSVLEESSESMHPEVKSHIESVVAGTVPFGYSVSQSH